MLEVLFYTVGILIVIFIIVALFPKGYAIERKEVTLQKQILWNLQRLDRLNRKDPFDV